MPRAKVRTIYRVNHGTDCLYSTVDYVSAVTYVRHVQNTCTEHSLCMDAKVNKDERVVS